MKKRRYAATTNNKQTAKYKQASTFSGIGGMDIGGFMHGFETAFACDWHEASRQFFENNFPNVPFYKGDVRNVTLELINVTRANLELEPISIGELDVFTAGSPCVKIASCNTTDAREFAPENLLMVENLVWMVRDLQPKIAWFENSDRLVSKKNCFLKEELYASIKNLLPNYVRQTKVIYAPRYGGLQTRSRAMTVLVRKDVLNGRKISFFPEPEPINLATQGAHRILPHIESFWAGQFGKNYKRTVGRIFCTLTASGGEMVQDYVANNRPLSNSERMLLTGMSEYDYANICKTHITMLLGNMVLRQISERFFKHFTEVIL